MHATRYQYGFSLTPERLREKKRCLSALDGISRLGEVAGNHSRFLYDFSPESIVLRISEDPAPRILYCFQEQNNNITVHDLVRKIEIGDILKEELYIGGLAADLPEIKALDLKNYFSGIKETVEECKTAIKQKLQLKE